MANKLYIPLINPVKFYDPTLVQLPQYFTKQFDDYDFAQRLYDWQQREEYVRVWQTSDIIKVQFESDFDPIIVESLDRDGNTIDILPALIGLPNRKLPGLYSYEVQMSLAGYATGCFKLRATCGPNGPTQRILETPWMYVYDGTIDNTILIEYRNTTYHEDVIFETGFAPQFRVHGHIGFLEPGRADEFLRDQNFNPYLLNSQTSRTWTVFFGDEFGLPDDIIDLLNRIWSCNTVYIDGKSFGVTEGGKFEFTEVDSQYPKRGVKLTVEEGINRRSSVFNVDVDPNKKLVMTIIVEAKVFGDTGNQGSANTVPVFNIE